MSIFGILAAFGAARIKDALTRNVRLAALYAAAGFLFVCGIGFFLAALHTWLQMRFGPIAASLMMGAGFVVIAIVVIAAAKIYAGRARKNSTALAAAASAAMPVAAALSTKSMTPKILGILGALAVGGILGRQIIRKD